MKNVLIIHRFYQASSRIPGVAKHLPECGWRPIILSTFVGKHLASQCGYTEDWKRKNRVVETASPDVLGFWKKLLQLDSSLDLRSQIKERLGVASRSPLIDVFLMLCGEIFNYPDSEKGWRPFAVRAGSELFRKEDIHAIISSSSPVTAHLIAKDLKRKHKVPWVADFRDLWTQNHNYHYGPLRKLIDRRLELKTLSEADALVTVSQPWAEKLETLHRGRVVYSIPHGFDPQTGDMPLTKVTSHFTISYTGDINPRWMNPTKLLAALQDLVSDGTLNPGDLEVRFYGSKYDWMDRQIENHGLGDIVRQLGGVPKQVALERQRESQLLLHLDWSDPEDKGVYGTKIFEYLGARRPIFSVCGSDGNVVCELLAKTGAGYHVSSVERIKDTFRNLYQEYRAKGELSYGGKETEINKYSYPAIASEFARILDRLMCR